MFHELNPMKKLVYTSIRNIMKFAQGKNDITNHTNVIEVMVHQLTNLENIILNKTIMSKII